MKKRMGSFLVLIFIFLAISENSVNDVNAISSTLFLPIIMESSWEEVGAGSATGGGVSQNESFSLTPAIAVGGNGVPYIAWSDNSSGNYEIYVRRWIGGSWEEVGPGSATAGGISNNSGESKSPDIQIAPDNTPYITWWDDSAGNDEIYVRRWNGSMWEEVGTGSANGGGISNNSGDSRHPALGIAPDGTPYVAWENIRNGTWDIYVRRWSGTTWVQVGAGSAFGGGISNNPMDAISAALAIGQAGDVYVTWHSYLTNAAPEIFILVWNGIMWEEVGAGSASGGGISNNDMHKAFPSIAVSPDGGVFVAWQNGLYGGPLDRSYIYARYWDGVSWQEIGPGSASETGIAMGEQASVAIGSNGIPYLAWSSVCFFSEPCDIFVRRWKDGVWAEVGMGSATGSGISNDGYSYTPDLTIEPGNIPYITWSSRAIGNPEIYILRHLE